jgi:hypothetical protein
MHNYSCIIILSVLLLIEAHPAIIWYVKMHHVMLFIFFEYLFSIFNDAMQFGISFFPSATKKRED